MLALAAANRPGSVPSAEADVALLRERLESGKRPRVMLLVDTALGAAGTSVPVVGFADPAVGEFISIRLRDDVVPFSPAELSLPVRGAKPAAVRRPRRCPLDPPADTPSRPSHPSQGYRPSGEPARPAARLVAVPEPEAAEPNPFRARGVHRAGRRRHAPPRLPNAAARRMSVTLRFNGQAWTYESTPRRQALDRQAAEPRSRTGLCRPAG